MKEHENHSNSIKNSIYKIDGVGVSLAKFKVHNPEEIKALRTELGYKETDFIITVVAELNKNKNQIMLVKSALELAKEIPTLKILLIGKETLPIVRNYVTENNLFDYVEFLGYRQDVDKLTAISDIAFSASLREGLPVNIIEAMACGIPVVCSKNRGHVSLIKDLETGFVFSLSDSKKMKESIILLYKNPLLRKQISERNVIEAQKYSVDIAVSKMADIYKNLM